MKDTKYYIYWPGTSRKAVLATKYAEVQANIGEDGIVLTFTDPIAATKALKSDRPSWERIKKVAKERYTEKATAKAKANSWQRDVRRNQGHK